MDNDQNLLTFVHSITIAARPFPLHLVKMHLSFSWNRISMDIHFFLCPFNRLIMRKCWSRPRRLMNIPNISHSETLQNVSLPIFWVMLIEQTFNLLLFYVLVDFRIRWIIRPKMGGQFIDEEMNILHINTLFRLFALRMLRCLLTFPMSFCRNWKILLMCWWFVVDATGTCPLVLLVSQCFLSSLCVWRNLPPAVSRGLRNSWCWTNEESDSIHLVKKLRSSLFSVSYLIWNFGVQINSIEQPIKNNSVSPGNLFYRWTLAFDYHLHYSLRRMCVCGICDNWLTFSDTRTNLMNFVSRLSQVLLQWMTKKFRWLTIECQSNTCNKQLTVRIWHSKAHYQYETKQNCRAWLEFSFDSSSVCLSWRGATGFPVLKDPWFQKVCFGGNEMGDLHFQTHGRMPEFTWQMFTEFQSAWNIILVFRIFLSIAWSLWGFLFVVVNLFRLWHGMREKTIALFVSHLCPLFSKCWRVMTDWICMTLPWNIVHVPSTENTLPLSSQRKGFFPYDSWWLIYFPQHWSDIWSVWVLILWSIWIFTTILNLE